MHQDFATKFVNSIKQKKLKRKLEQDLKSVELELQNQLDRLETLLAQLNKERVDIEKMEGISIKALFYLVLGTHEKQLEKERQEHLSAHLSYKQTKEQVAYLNQEKNTLLQRLDKLFNVDVEYESLLLEKESILSMSHNDASRGLLKNEENIAALGSEIKEIGEAIAAGNIALFRLNRVTKSLQSAEG